MTNIFDFIKSLFHSMLELFWFGKKRISNSLSIYIKSNVGSTLSVDLNPKWDIKNVKELVAPQLGLQPSEVKIIFAGKELCDDITIEQCDLGQQSVLHAIRVKPKLNKSELNKATTVLETEVENALNSGSKPLCETLLDLQLTPEERRVVLNEEDRKRQRAHFYVYCATCKDLKIGKLRVRCNICKSGAITVNADPQCWDDVLIPNRINGECKENNHETPKEQPSSSKTEEKLVYAEFYFKCSEHTSQGEEDQAVPLYLIKSNLNDIPCLACTDVSDPVLVFPCEEAHVTCLECFKNYCGSRLRDRQFWPHEIYGYTLGCPAGCDNSYISEIHHFRLLSEVQYLQYQRFATEEYVLLNGGVLCPQIGCGMGILIEENCERITCRYCGYSWTRNDNSNGLNVANSVDNLWARIHPTNAQRSRWVDRDSNSTFDFIMSTKPCPKCGIPTERDGGCMHMICGSGSCKFHWCWICHSAWTRDCMGNHWFG